MNTLAAPRHAPLPTTRRASPRPDDAPALIRVADVCIRYGGRPVLAGVSMSIHARRITALVGPSGCGKTSFLSCLNRLADLVPSCSVSGAVFLDGKDIRAPDCDVMGLRRRVGMIFQKPNPFPLSVRKNLEFPLREHGLRDRAGLDRAVEAALRDVGLWDEVKDRLGAPALALSGGQQQRLCIARAIALEPDVLLMDEPCSALDPLSSGVVEDLVARLRRRYTVLIVTHNLAQARRLADQVAVFWAVDGVGRLVEHGDVQQIFDAPRDPLTAAYVRGLRG